MLQEKVMEVVANVKRMTLRKGDRLGKTKGFYRMFGGGCRQLLTVNGKVDEFPYSAEKAALCKLPAPHPHRIRISARTVERL